MLIIASILCYGACIMADDSNPKNPEDFPTTSWRFISQARDADAARAEEALAHLCQIYWFPLYAFARREFDRPDDAADKMVGGASRETRLFSSWATDA